MNKSIALPNYGDFSTVKHREHSRATLEAQRIARGIDIRPFLDMVNQKMAQDPLVNQRIRQLSYARGRMDIVF